MVTRHLHHEMKKVQHESAGPFVISLRTEEGSRTQSGREREGRQSGELPGSERSEAGQADRRGGSTQARSAAGGRSHHLRSFQTRKTGDETGGFLPDLGMKREYFDSFGPGEREKS